MAVTIVIVDDHPVISHGLKHILGKQEDFNIVGSAQNGMEAIRLVEETKPQVVILDISLEDINTINLIGRMLEISETTSIIMYTMHNAKTYIARSLKAGALGYVLKGDKTDELVQAVRNVITKKVYLSSNISPSIMGELITGNLPGGDGTVDLTPREYEVASLISKGRTVDEIGEDLFISPKTVRVHRTNIMHKLACKNVHELLLQLRQHFPQ